jgi:hypothetical protein
MIETDTGYKGMIALKDAPAEQRFIIARGKYAWVRLTILESIRGSASPNVCLTEFLVNLEELADR